MKDLKQIIPDQNLKFPEEIDTRKEKLLLEMLACKNDPNIRRKLRLLIKAFKLFSDQEQFMMQNKVRALAVLERDRLIRHRKELPHGRTMAKFQSPRSS